MDVAPVPEFGEQAPADGAAGRSRSFGQAAEEYDRSRASPPTAVLDWLLSGNERVVLDLAAGTGQISRRLGGASGLQVIAVEPDPAMRAVCARTCPHAQVLDGTAERIPLTDDSVDAVLVGSAWHWFDPRLAPDEIARVLRPGGRLGVVGTSPDPSVDWVRTVLGSDEVARLRHANRRYSEASLPRTAFDPVEVDDRSFTWSLSRRGAAAFFTTASHYLVASDQERAGIDARIAAVLTERFTDADRVALPMRAHCWRTRRRSR